MAALWKRDGRTTKVWVLDLSETGAFVGTGVGPGALDVQVGDRAVLDLALPGGAPWPAQVTVVRFGVGQRELRREGLHHLTVSCHGVGVVFDAVPEDEVERLRGFLELLDER